MSEDEKQCPFCGETIKSIAIICKHCKSSLVEGKVKSNKNQKYITCPFCHESTEDLSECQHCNSEIKGARGETVVKNIYIKNDIVESKKKNNGLALLLLIALAGFGYYYFNSGDFQSVNKNLNKNISSSSVKLEYLNQKDFEKIIDDYRVKYMNVNSGSNEILATKIRVDRKNSISLLPNNFQNWHVIFRSAWTSKDGTGGVNLESPNYPFISYKYSFRPSDKFYDLLSSLNKGDSIYLTGDFKLGNKYHYFDEGSFTESGAMKSPEFKVNLESASKNKLVENSIDSASEINTSSQQSITKMTSDNSSEKLINSTPGAKTQNIPSTDQVNTESPVKTIQNEGKIFRNNDLNILIESAYSGNREVVEQIIEKIKQLPKPVRGNKPLARKLNDEGLAAMKENKYLGASILFSQGVDADPSDKEIINNYASSLFYNGQYDDGIKTLEKTLSLSIDRTTAWFNLYDELARNNKSIETTCGALLLGLNFSKNITNSINYIEKGISEEKDQNIVANKRKASDCAKFKFVSSSQKLYNASSKSNGSDDNKISILDKVANYISKNYPNANKEYDIKPYRDTHGYILTAVKITNENYCSGSGGCPTIMTLNKNNQFKILFDELSNGYEDIDESTFKFNFNGSVCNLYGYEKCEIIYKIENEKFVKKMINGKNVN